MSAVPSTSSTPHSNFAFIFNTALEQYKRKTKHDLAKHPLLPTLQSCDSPEAILTVLREQSPNQSQNGDDGHTKWIIPTVNVLYSFSATLGGVVGLAFPPANIIFKGIGVLLLATKDVRANRDKVIDLFSSIERFFQRLEIYTGITPTTAMTDIVVDIMVEVLAILATATKEVKCGRLKRFFRKLVGNTEIEDSLQRLDRLTQEEARMACAESLKVTHGVDAKVMGVDDRVRDVEGKVEDVQDDVQDVGNKVENVDGRVQDVQVDVHDVGNKVQDVGSDVNDISCKVREVNRNQLRDSLLRWLSPSDPSINHNIASKTHHDGTAQWFFQGNIFNQWKSTGSFLWIHGKPGSGKSTLCSSIIQDIMSLRDAGTASMAYFYFDFRDVDKQRLHNLLPSLLIQLSARSDPCHDILSQLYSAHDRGEKQPSDRAMVECLKKMLTIEVQEPTYIIMDALDECPITSTIPSPREEVLELVDELVGLHLSNLHICVTSRPESDIQAFLGPLTSRPVSLHDESGQQHDIADYVSSFVHSDRRMRRWREEDKDLVIKTLSEKADGMFRWVFCQLEVLRHCFPPSVRRILEELPDSLDETYERILREIRKSNQGLARRLMQCLVAAVRPLQVKELAEVLAFDFNAEGIPKLNQNWRWEDQEEAVMSACSSLVTIVKDGGSPIVQFSHFSVKEFLTADRLAEPMRDVSRYHIELEAAHTILAQACIGVLLRLDDHVDRDNIEDFPLAPYAAEYWPKHAKFGSVSARIKDGMECLFDEDKPHFATWLWIYEERDGDRMTTMRPEKPRAVPLYHAAWLGFRDLAAHLIAEHPEHVNARGYYEETTIHAATAGNTDILSLILEHNVDVDGRGMLGRTPLHPAASSGKLDIGQCLLDHGADINALNHLGWTPLFKAAGGGHVEFAQMLLERGAVIDARDNGGRTALSWAVEGGKIQVVRLLLKHGADVNAHDKFGRTASQFTTRQEILELLSEYGAESVN
ncbi:hypothetical protein V8E52_005411 [Russula decolorans]